MKVKVVGGWLVVLGLVSGGTLAASNFSISTCDTKCQVGLTTECGEHGDCAFVELLQYRWDIKCPYSYGVCVCRPTMLPERPGHGCVKPPPPAPPPDPAQPPPSTPPPAPALDTAPARFSLAACDTRCIVGLITECGDNADCAYVGLLPYRYDAGCPYANGVCVCRPGFVSADPDQGGCVPKPPPTTPAPATTTTPTTTTTAPPPAPPPPTRAPRKPPTRRTAPPLRIGAQSASSTRRDTVELKRAEAAAGGGRKATGPWGCRESACPSSVNKACAAREMAGPEKCGSSRECYHGGVCTRISGAKEPVCVCPLSHQGYDCSQLRSLDACPTVDEGPVRMVQKGRRFVHPRGEDKASVGARHQVRTLSDCRRLCVWSGPRLCRSFNFIQISADVALCELLRVWAHKGLPLSAFLREEPRSSYHCCFGEFKRRIRGSRAELARRRRRQRRRLARNKISRRRGAGGKG